MRSPRRPMASVPARRAPRRVCRTGTDRVDHGVRLTGVEEGLVEVVGDLEAMQASIAEALAPSRPQAAVATLQGDVLAIQGIQATLLLDVAALQSSVATLQGQMTSVLSSVQD